MYRQGNEAQRGYTSHKQNLNCPSCPRTDHKAICKVAFTASCAGVALGQFEKQHLLSCSQSILTTWLYCFHAANRKPQLQRHSQLSTTQGVLAKWNPGTVARSSSSTTLPQLSQPSLRIPTSVLTVWQVVQLRIWPQEYRQMTSELATCVLTDTQLPVLLLNSSVLLLPETRREAETWTQAWLQRATLHRREGSRKSRHVHAVCVPKARTAGLLSYMPFIPLLVELSFLTFQIYFPFQPLCACIRYSNWICIFHWLGESCQSFSRTF